MSAVPEVGQGAVAAGRRRRGDVAPYAAGWAAAGSVAAAAVLAVGTGPFGVVAVAAIVAITVVAELVEVRVTLDRTDSSFTLGESAIAAAMLLLPDALALLAVLSGLGLVQLVRRRGWLKSAFNLGQVAVAMAAALAVSGLFPHGDGSVVGIGPLVGVAAGMVVYGLVNVAAMAGLFRRLAGRSILGGALEHGGQLMGSVVGNTAIGMLIAALWETQPGLLVLLAAPAAAMHLSSRGSLRSLMLLADVRSERDRLDRVIVGASDGIALLDPHGRIEMWSPALAELTGIAAEQAVGRTALGLLAPGAEGRDLFASTHEGTQWHVATTIRRPDGTARDVDATHTVLVGTDGLADGTVSVVRDVTRQREIETMKHDFVARVSHELRTPLAPIQGVAQALLRHRSRMDDDRIERALGLIAERSQHMGRLVEDLLLVSRITAPDSTIVDGLDLVAVDVHDVVEKTVGWLTADHPDRALNISGARTSAFVDELRTTQIVTNLLSNACKYSPATSDIDIEIADDGTAVTISVDDRGPGIPDDKKQTIFERFQRLEDPMTMTTGGAGLGLFISRQLAEAMGGTLDVTDRPGRGSRFVLTLPKHDTPGPG